MTTPEPQDPQAEPGAVPTADPCPCIDCPEPEAEP